MKGLLVTNEELLDAWPGIRIDQDNAAYFGGLLNQQLLMNRCEECSRWHHPPRPICPACWSRSLVPTPVAGTGSVALVTILRQGPSQPGVDYRDGHPLVAIELDEQPGLRFAGTIIDTPPADIAVGDRVEMVWRTVPGRRARPDFRISSTPNGATPTADTTPSGADR